MKKITVNQITQIIDDTLKAIKDKNIKFKNLLFVGNTGIGKSAKINEWAQKHNDFNVRYLIPGPLCIEKNGILVKERDKNNNPIYAFDEQEINIINNQNQIVIINNFNKLVHNQQKAFSLILSERKYIFPYINKHIELNNLGLIIAFAYPDNEFFNLEPMDVENFDIYEVHPDVQEFKEFFIDYANNEKINSLKANKFIDILNSTHFHFIETNKELFVPYHFIQLFDWCKNDSNIEIMKQILSNNKSTSETALMFDKILSNN